jgi:hypothetical protein
MPIKQIQIQLGGPFEHRGVVVAPLFPREQPRAEYLTLEEGSAHRFPGRRGGRGRH